MLLLQAGLAGWLFMMKNGGIGVLLCLSMVFSLLLVYLLRHWVRFVTV